MMHQNYDEDLEYLNTRGDLSPWVAMKAKRSSRCKHCGDEVCRGEEFYWNLDSISVHKDCVPLMQGLEHALSKDD